MDQNDKQLLLKDLCARLLFGVKCYIEFDDGKIFSERTLMPIMIQDFESHGCLVIKPYLRPMSSMTEEEEIEYDATFATIKNSDGHYDSTMTYKSFDFLNVHHFDYRGLIEKGLALEAPEGMYNLNEK